MEKEICKNCTYFRQHYTFDQRKIFRVYCGHCVQNPTKRRKPDAIACEEFVSSSADESAFVTREYLSKELLRYALSLELLPQIEDAP